MKKFYILHHLGMGDHLHCNGMVRHIRETLLPEWDICLFSWQRNFKNVEYMYRDDSSIEVVPLVDDVNEMWQVEDHVLEENQFVEEHQMLLIGYSNFPKIKTENPEYTCDQCFYKQIDIPYEHRFDKFYFEREPKEEERVFNKLVPEGKEYVFVHDNPSKGYTIDVDKIDQKYEIVNNDITESIFHFSKILENASEIHCIESSFRCFIEGLDTSKAKHYFHPVNTEFSKFDNDNLGTGTSKEWTLVKYEPTNLL